MTPCTVSKRASGGRTIARRIPTAVLLLAGVAAQAIGADVRAPRVEVTEAGGTYQVSAEFVVTQPASAVIALLTDYERIPKIMPDVRSSTVLERESERALVAQEAVAKFMLVSKRVHVVLDIQQDGQTIRFRDTCGRSFEQYEGAWTIVEQDGGTAVRYALTAKPKSDVPEFLVKRLLKRDATAMAQRLQAEIETRR
jgi:ribosome-associated toxin RatA of RatAB toxin-antitoxin module